MKKGKKENRLKRGHSIRNQQKLVAIRPVVMIIGGSEESMRMWERILMSEDMAPIVMFPEMERNLDVVRVVNALFVLRGADRSLRPIIERAERHAQYIFWEERVEELRSWNQRYWGFPFMGARNARARTRSISGEGGEGTGRETAQQGD